MPPDQSYWLDSSFRINYDFLEDGLSMNFFTEALFNKVSLVSLIFGSKSFLPELKSYWEDTARMSSSFCIFCCKYSSFRCKNYSSCYCVIFFYLFESSSSAFLFLISLSLWSLYSSSNTLSAFLLSFKVFKLNLFLGVFVLIRVGWNVQFFKSYSCFFWKVLFTYSWVSFNFRLFLKLLSLRRGESASSNIFLELLFQHKT